MKKQAYYLKHKVKAIIALVVLMAMVLLHNLAGRQRVNELQHSVSSIYNDRLMPATYIFHITDHMYQKKLLQEHEPVMAVRTRAYQKHNEAIASLVKSYDSTYLTPEEKQQWQLFKHRLVAYNKAEAVNGTSQLDGKQEESFYRAMNSLHQLASIQAGEGNKLDKSSRNIVLGNDTVAGMEMAILLILALCVVLLVSLPEKVTVPESTTFSVN